MKILAIDDEIEIDPLSEKWFRCKVLSEQKEFTFAYLDKEALFYLRQYFSDIDINSLADEYLRLSYLKLKTKYQNLKGLTTDFDAGLSKVDMVPQGLKGYCGKLKVENKEKKGVDSSYHHSFVPPLNFA